MKNNSQNWIVCRVCLTQSKEQMHSIFDENDEKDLTKKLLECGGVPIKRFDHYPDKICPKCLKVLLLAYKFRLTCQSSYNHLSRFMAPVVVEQEQEQEQEQETEQDTEHEITSVFEEDEEIGVYQDVEIDEQEEEEEEDDEVVQEVTIQEDEQQEEDIQEIVQQDAVQQDVVHKAEHQQEEEEEVHEDLEAYEHLGEVEAGEFRMMKPEPHQVKQEYSDADDVFEIYCPMEEEIEPVDDGESIVFSDAGEQAQQSPFSADAHAEYLEDGTEGPITDEEYLPIDKDLQRQPAVKRKYERSLTKQRKPPGRKPNVLNKSKDEVRKRGPKPKKEKKTAYICDICGNIYPSQGRLTEHIKLHKGIKPHECEICGHCFAQTQQLARHMNTHTGNRPYKCTYCPAAFADLSTRNKHHRIHTNERPYVCDVCGKAFTYTNTLKFHKMIHTGEKPFVCEICGKGFQQAYKLRNHKYTHARKGIQIKAEVEEVKVETYVLEDPYEAVINAPAQILEI